MSPIKAKGLQVWHFVLTAFGRQKASDSPSLEPPSPLERLSIESPKLLAGRDLWPRLLPVLVMAAAGSQAAALVVGLVGVDARVAAGIREAATGRDVLLVVAPPDSAWKKGAPNVARLVFEDRVDLLLCGADRVTAHIAAQIATKARIPLVTLCREPALGRIFDPWIVVASQPIVGDGSGLEQGRRLMASILLASEGADPAAAGFRRRLADRLGDRLAKRDGRRLIRGPQLEEEP